MPTDEFSVRWSRHVRFDSGWYRFALSVDDGVRFWVDGSLLVDEWWVGESAEYEAIAHLDQGYHALEVEYCDTTGPAAAQLAWEAATFEIHLPLTLKS